MGTRRRGRTDAAARTWRNLQAATTSPAGWHLAVPPGAYGDHVSDLSPADFENLLAFRTGLRRFLHWSQTQARAVGLTPAQHQLLVAIKGHPGGQHPTISELAGYLLLRHHSVVELVDRAEGAGLVERQGDSEDGRLTRVRLTRDGQSRLSRLTPAHLDELRNLAPVLNQLVAGSPVPAGEAGAAGEEAGQGS